MNCNSGATLLCAATAKAVIERPVITRAVKAINAAETAFQVDTSAFVCSSAAVKHKASEWRMGSSSVPENNPILSCPNEIEDVTLHMHPTTFYAGCGCGVKGGTQITCPL